MVQPTHCFEYYWHYIIRQVPIMRHFLAIVIGILAASWATAADTPHRAEPADILNLKMSKMTPLPPYCIDIYDVLEIRVKGTMLEQPIDGFYLVEGEGSVNLGSAYGTVSIRNATASEAENTITKRLREVLAAPKVSVQVVRRAGDTDITGEYVVGEDGTIKLRKSGELHVAGKTATEIKAAVRKRLAQYWAWPAVSVEVWHARPVPDGTGCDTVFPVDYQAIITNNSSATNYSILPGDRIFVSEKDFSGLSMSDPSGKNETKCVPIFRCSRRSISVRQWRRMRSV